MEPEKKEEIQEEVLDLDAEAELAKDSVKVHIPKELNINFHGEWIFVIGAMVYGISVRKSDNKALITYNIAPDQIMGEHFNELDITDVPRKIYTLFLKKLASDIARIDNMLLNLGKNKKIINILFNVAEEMTNYGSDGMEDALEYTTEDAVNDKKITELQQKNKKTMTRSAKVQKRAVSKEKRKQGKGRDKAKGKKKKKK